MNGETDILVSNLDISTTDGLYEMWFLRLTLLDKLTFNI